MLVFRFATVLAIVVWIGGLLTIGAIAAPAVFEIVSLRQAPDARLLSGAIVGEILQRFHVVSYGCGAGILGGLLVRAVLGPRPRYFAVRFGIATAMLAATLYSGLVITRHIADVQQAIGPVAASSLAADDPRRVAFGRLHGYSTLIQFIPLLGGVVLLLFELKDKA